MICEKNMVVRWGLVGGGDGMVGGGAEFIFSAHKMYIHTENLKNLFVRIHSTDFNIIY